MRVWNARTGESEGVLRGKYHDVRTVAFEPGALRLGAAGSDGFVELWDVPAGKLVSRRETPGGD